LPKIPTTFNLRKSQALFDEAMNLSITDGSILLYRPDTTRLGLQDVTWLVQ